MALQRLTEQQFPAAQQAVAEEEEEREDTERKNAKQAIASGEEAASSLAPWAPEPAAPHSQAEQINYLHLIQIREQLRRAGLGLAALEEWIKRLESISAIIEKGCRLNGTPGAGELLLDMVGDLVEDINDSGSSPTHEDGTSLAAGEERETA